MASPAKEYDPDYNRNQFSLGCHPDCSLANEVSDEDAMGRKQALGCQEAHKGYRNLCPAIICNKFQLLNSSPMIEDGKRKWEDTEKTPWTQGDCKQCGKTLEYW